MSQLSFTEAEFSGKRKRTRRERFLCEMNKTIPWDYLAGEVARYYPESGKSGRQRYPVETMLRIHFMHTGLAHTVVGTPANAANVTQTAALLRGEEALVFGDAGYQGVEKRAEPQGHDVQELIAMHPGRITQIKRGLAKAQIEVEYLKASLRAKVEHSFSALPKRVTEG